MADNDTHEPTETATGAGHNGPVDGTGSGDGVGDTAPDDRVAQPDGGTVTQAAQDHQRTDYLDSEVNLLRPSTPFMRDHLKVVWGTFIAWVLVVWGPVTATYVAPGLMTTTMPVIEFPLHYFLVALGAPTGALVLAAVYARQRDRLDERYGIDPGAVEHQESAAEAAAADGGVEE